MLFFTAALRAVVRLAAGFRAGLRFVAFFGFSAVRFVAFLAAGFAFEDALLPRAPAGALRLEVLFFEERDARADVLLLRFAAPNRTSGPTRTSGTAHLEHGHRERGLDQSTASAR